ncbi:MAG: two-component system sensor histidine kinase NtrB [Nitrospinales bacterium]
MDDQKDLYHNIFSSLIDGVIVVGHDELILNANVAAEEIFQQSSDFFVGKNFSELIPDQPEILEKIRQTVQNGISFRDLECVGHRKSNAINFPANLTLSPFLSKENQLQGALILVRDMSLFKELEGTSRQLERIASLGVLSLGMAHEIKNPLVAIGGSAQLLHSRLDDPENKEFLDVVIEEVKRIDRMVERMLGLARPGKLEVKPVNIHKVLGDILLLEKNTKDKKIDFDLIYDPSLPSIEADEDQLKQVFLNLIRNAIDSMSAGGQLTLVTRINSGYAVKTNTENKTRQDIIIEIIDSGGGISEEDQKKLFTPFFTTKSKGNGLGLPISLKIIEDHQGGMKINSEMGRGTTVQVNLPIEQRKL